MKVYFMSTELDAELSRKHFRVVIFGSARIRKGDPIYTMVYDLAKLVSAAEMDIVTGAGPGLMNAASEGHHDGRRSGKSHSVGLRIDLPMEEAEAWHLDIKKEFNRFSNRLESFMNLSNVVVVAPGGVGTMLEFFYTWQLLQVKQLSNIPIILLGYMWLDLVHWIKEWPLRRKMLNTEDIELLFLARNCSEAFTIIEKTYEAFRAGDKNFCLNYRKFKIQKSRRKK
jgi:predicted Rossmann-fold nucleotide-binding protein